MTLLTAFAHVSKARLCPICDRPDWCLIDRADPPARAICQGIETSRR